MKWAIVVALAACQSRDPKRDRPAPSLLADAALVSIAADASESTRAPLPPLPDPLPGKRRDISSIVGAATRVAIGDLDGDGHLDLVLVDPEKLRVVRPDGRELASTPVPGGIEVLVVGDGAIYAGWGATRGHLDAKARITRHRLQRGKLVEETILEPETSRQDVTAIIPIEDHALFVAYYDSKYTVTSAFVRPGKAPEKVASIRMATSYARGDLDGDGKPELVVGRVYGDDKGVDGDAFVLAVDGTRTPIPSTRGLRSIAVLDGDGDGKPELFLGDGWHQNYGDKAHGLVTWVHGGASELIEDTAGQYSIERIILAKVDGKPVVVASGSHYVRAFTRGERWRGQTIAGAALDIAVGDLDGDGSDDLVVLGKPSAVVDLRGIF